MSVGEAGKIFTMAGVGDRSTRLTKKATPVIIIAPLIPVRR